MTFCIFSIIKDEHLYLDEFIQHHLNIGIDHIFLAEDYDSKSHKSIVEKYSSDNVTLMSILDVFPEERHRQIIYEKTHRHKMQKKYLKAGIQFIKDHYDYDWCFIIDIDEYITPDKKFNSLSEIFELYKDYDAVVIQWQNYGASGLMYMPDYSKQLIIETYTNKIGYQKSDDEQWWQKVKTVYNMNKYNDTLRGDRLPQKESNWCKTNFLQDKESYVFDNIYIRHYITKSWEEYVIKLKIRGMFYMSHRNYDSFFEMNPEFENNKEEMIKWANDYIMKKGRT